MNAHRNPTRGKSLRPVNTLTFTQRLAAHALLTERIELLESGLCKYKDPNANDTTIAAELGPEYNNSNIKSIRAECFGRIWKQPAAPVHPAPMVDYSEDIRVLNKNCENLQINIQALTDHVNRRDQTNLENINALGLHIDVRTKDYPTEIARVSAAADAMTTRYHHAMERIEVLEKRFTGLLEKVNRK
jgi:hypothetical protein